MKSFKCAKCGEILNENNLNGEVYIQEAFEYECPNCGHGGHIYRNKYGIFNDAPFK